MRGTLEYVKHAQGKTFKWYQKVYSGKSVSFSPPTLSSPVLHWRCLLLALPLCVLCVNILSLYKWMCLCVCVTMLFMRIFSYKFLFWNFESYKEVPRIVQRTPVRSSPESPNVITFALSYSIPLSHIYMCMRVCIYFFSPLNQLRVSCKHDTPLPLITSVFSKSRNYLT